MTKETGAAAPTDAPQPQGGAGSEQATPPEQSVPSDDAATENAETAAQPEGEGEASEEANQDDRPKRPSRTERMKRRMQAMATELDSLRSQLGEFERIKANPDDGAPKESDFNGDYFAFQAAKIAHENRVAVRVEFNEQRQRETQQKLADKQREISQEFEERAEEFRARIPDFDKAIESFVLSGGKFSQALVEELQSSDVGPALAYQIAKNPQLANSLSQLSPREVAREVGRLEAKVSLPNPNRTTKAPPPLKSVAGGAAAPADLSSLAKSMDASAYIQARNQQEKARAKS